MRLRNAILLAALFALPGCERDVPTTVNQKISGYEIFGTITSSIGNPIPNVSISLDYQLDVLPPDTSFTILYLVDDPITPVQAVAVDWTNRIVRALTAAQRVTGMFKAYWDGTDSSGALVPSGVYQVQYVQGGRVRYAYSQIVGGGMVAKTDANGNFTIPNQNLPINFSSAPAFSFFDSSYVGNYHVESNVILQFSFPGHIRQLEVLLNQDQVTVVNVTFD